MTPTGAFLALVPAVFVPSLLLWGGESLWPAVLAYHAYCAALPLAFRFSAREAGFALAGARRWLPWTLALCVLLLASGVALARLVDVKRLLPDGWEPLLAHARPWWAFAAYSLLVNAPSDEYFLARLPARVNSWAAGARARSFLELIHHRRSPVRRELPDVLGGVIRVLEGVGHARILSDAGVKPGPPQLRTTRGCPSCRRQTESPDDAVHPAKDPAVLHSLCGA